MKLRARVLPGLFLAGCAPASPVHEPTPSPMPVEASTAPVPPPASTVSMPVQDAPAPPISWRDDREAALAHGVARGRAVLVFVVATWQPRSQYLERHLWTDEDVRRAAADVVTLRVDATDAADGELEHWLTERGIDHVPAVGLIHPDGAVIGALTGPEVAKAEVLRLLRSAP